MEKLFLTIFCLTISCNSFAFTNYVSAAGSETPPYDSWATAAKSIQLAVDYAVDGNVVLVTNDTYTVSSHILINTNNIILKSVNGAENTVINGNSTTHCIYLRGDSVIDGFSILNGRFSNGGGIYVFGSGSVLNCIFTNNIAGIDGGAIRARKALVSNCYFFANEAINGGALYMRFSSSVKDCVFENNKATNGGGIYCYNSDAGPISDCVISNNNAQLGGGVYCSLGGSLTNCLIIGMNTADFGGGAYLEGNGELFNCTIAGNHANDSGGGIFCTNDPIVVNSIIYDNQADISGDNWFDANSEAAFGYSCTFPLTGLPGENECISNNPKFVAPGSDYHLQNTSLCRNSGSNMVWMTGATDLDGNPRITDGTVDMGCYEIVIIPEPFLFINCYLLLIIYYLRNRKIKF